MFSWGETTRNGFGLMKANDLLKHNADTGVSFTPPLNPPITRLSASNKVILFTRKDGKVSIARIQESQDGKIITSRPKPVQIKAHIWTVSSGDFCVLLLSRGGNVWCLDLNGNSSVPKLLDTFHNRKVIQVSCGEQHSIALTQDGLVFTWGKNTNGQLGLGYTERPIIRSPEPIKALSGVPLAQITAGGDHSFALSLSGTVFGWGHNSAGQLGLGNTTDSYTPVPVVCLSLKKAISISCGQKHTAVLTKGGLVFTFGSGCYGQLGHNSLRDEVKPRLVAELWGAEVTQISCGRNHTLALVGSSNRKIYSFGQGQKGQLGNGVKTDQSVPLPVNLSQDGKDDEQICHIFAGGNYSVALCSFDQKSEEKASSPISGIKTLDENTVEMWLSECDDPKSWKRIQRDIKTTFSSPMCLNGSFLDSLDKHYQTSPRYSGLDMSLARIAFEKLATKDKVLNEIAVVVRDTLLPSLCKDPIGVESLRIFLIVPELLRVLVRQGHGTELTTAVAAAILSLNGHKLQILEGLWSRIPYFFFRSAVKTFCIVSAKHLTLTDDQYDKDCRSLFSNLRVLQKMYDVNCKSPRSLPAKVFHIDTVRCVFLPFKELLEEYNMMEAMRLFYPPSYQQECQLYEAKTFYENTIAILMACPCILDTTAKCGFWDLQIRETKDLHGQHFLRFFENKLLVGRSTLLQDTFDCLRKKSCYLKVPVKVKFKEENGVDEGGVSMEFFNLLGKELLNSKPPILQVNEYGLAWFSQDDDSVSDEFFLLGLICGMALYNRCLLNLCFPLVIFKKLLGLDPSMDDMEEMAPTEAQGLQQLLKYEEEIVEDLGLDFGWRGGQTLLPNGEMIPVTKVNRQKYVDLYIDMVFNKSVDGQFKLFQRGFLEGCPTHAWRMFLPDELMMLLHGDENFKWEELRENATYQGYVSTDEVIQNFWSVFTEFSGDQKKSFLTFLTGAERLPRARLSRLRVTIKILVTPDPDKHYPLAETCFETLQLPKYSSIHILRQKLLHAITYCEVIGNY